MAPTCSSAETSSPTNIDLNTRPAVKVPAKYRAQQSSLARRCEGAAGHHHIHPQIETTSKQSASLSYWHYKQTGVKSRPIKLLKHPIEHIERKILITYLLGFLFKLIAIFSGPLVVLCAYLLTLPFLVARRLLWFALNHLLGASIETGEGTEWRFCPLSCIETYWFRQHLVNTVVLALDGPKPLNVDRLRTLVHRNLLARPHFRKFLSRVEARGLPLYKSHYWCHLGLSSESAQVDGCGAQNGETKSLSSSSSGSTEDREEETTPSSCSTQFCINLPQTPPQEPREPSAEAADADADKVRLEDHIYLDKLAREPATHAAICRYVYTLLAKPLTVQRPLWELRVISSPLTPRSYLIFRCHQSLADGRSLSNILTNHLTAGLSGARDDVDTEAQQKYTCRSPSGDGLRGPSAQSDSPAQVESTLGAAPTTEPATDDDEEARLRCLAPKRSFVARMGSSNSWRSAIFVGPLTVLLWFIWTFTRRKNNHLNQCLSASKKRPKRGHEGLGDELSSSVMLEDPAHSEDSRRFHMTHYDLTRFWQIKQMTRSTVSDVILCALSGALRDYLRRFNGVSNPPNLNASLLVDMRQQQQQQTRKRRSTNEPAPPTPTASSTNNAQLSATGLEPDEAPQVNCTLVNVPLPISVEGTVPRLWELRDTMDELRTSADPWVMLGLQKFLFAVLPGALYQRLINYVALRNSSAFVSNISGPHNMVEGWCVDLLQRTMLEAQQSRAHKTQSVNDNPFIRAKAAHSEEEQMKERRSLEAKRRRENKSTRLRLKAHLGSLAAIYYCMQPPTSDIPISFNCITYHNKLFIAALSRSLLVEDSRLLIRLFFKQLDQMANTIAKRRSLVTIIRTPVPIEISCQPPSPDYRVSSPLAVASSTFDSPSPSDFGRNPVEEEQQPHYYRDDPASARSSPHLAVKDDVEMRIDIDDMCPRCRRPVCVCKRRKSLFSFDQNRVNLASILRPINFMNLKSAFSNEGFDKDPVARECVCGQRLLEELDEADCNREESADGTFSPTFSDLQLRPVSSRPLCAKCRIITQRSTLSLNASTSESHKNSAGEQWKDLGGYCSSSSVNRKQATNVNSTQLIVPRDGDLNSSHLSRSETDLLPKNRSNKKSSIVQKGLKGSWTTIARRGTRKMSIFSKLSGLQQQTSSPRNSEIQMNSNAKSRTLFDTPVDIMHKHFGDPLRRRRSLATSTSSQQTYHSVVVKDEINADVSLRCQLDGPILGLRNRRYSTVSGVAIRNQRRASLIPFGLIHNSSTPRMFCEDGQAHL